MVQRVLTNIDDDTDDAPWMVMGTPQSNATMALAVSLRTELRVRGDKLSDERGRLYSEVLGLWLVVRDGALRLERPDGSLVLTPEEEAAARRAAVAELARLRAELDRRAPG